MLGRRPIAISLLLLSALPLARVWAIEELDVPWHPPTKIDGVIGSEYPPPALSLVSKCRLYLFQNESSLFIAVAISDSTYNASDGIAICIGEEPPSPLRTPRESDHQMTVSRSGAFAAPGLTKYAIARAPGSSEWSAEVAIDFSELDLTAGLPRSIALALFIRDDGQEIVRWPDDADKESPKTWGKLYSSYFWGAVDLVPQFLALSNQRPNTGEDVTLSIEYMNNGSSAISGAQIGFYVDGVPIATIDDTRVIEASESYVVSTTWRATAGNHTISVKLDPMYRIRETREDNNEYAVNVFVRPFQLKIKAQEGVNVTVDGNTTTVGPSREYVQNVTLGAHLIRAQEMLNMDDTRYVFNKWEWAGGESDYSVMSLNVTGDMSLEAFYRTEYMIRLRFLDSAGDNVTPSEVRFSAPNGSSIVLNYTYDVWLRQGTITIANIIWSAVDVKPVDTTYPIQGPSTLTMNCRIYALTVEVYDSLSLPVVGANITLVLPNMTRVWLLTNSDGEAHFAQIPTGRLSGRVSYLGFITSIAEQDLTQDSSIRLSLALSLSTIAFVSSIVGAMALALILYWRKRGPRKPEQKPDKLLSSIGPPT